MTIWINWFHSTALAFVLWLPVVGLAGAKPAWAESLQLQLPVACALGSECFLQQLPDMNNGPEAVDSFCGSATYNGHKGTDIRLPRLEDISRDVPVVAAASGIVKAVRDGEPDRLVVSEADAKKVANRECGNGIVIAHEGGWETQYCHLKQNSVSVGRGDNVEAGDRLGSIGASGMAQFPHVHLSVRKNGKSVDPFTGNPLGEKCSADGNRNGQLWSATAAGAIGKDLSQIIAAGFADDVVDHQALGVELPKQPDISSNALVGWVYFINLEKGDRVAVTIIGPNETVLARNVSEPFDRSKAAYSIYTGKRGKPEKGQYRIQGSILRGDKVLTETRREIRIQ